MLLQYPRYRGPIQVLIVILACPTADHEDVDHHHHEACQQMRHNDQDPSPTSKVHRKALTRGMLINRRRYREDTLTSPLNQSLP